MNWGTPNTTNSNPWDGFDQIETRPARNAYLPSGLNCEAKIIELKTVKSQKNMGQLVFVAVVEIENFDGQREHYDWVAKMGERAYLVAIKSLMCAINPEADPSQIGSDVMQAACGPDQPCSGAVVRVRTETIQTRAGNDFTKVYWAPC